MSISTEREYVLLSWKWSHEKDYFLFWGRQTEDHEERSYSGYEMDINACEKYTEAELIKSNKRFWESRWKLHELDRSESYAVKLSDLDKFGRKKTIIYR